MHAGHHEIVPLETLLTEPIRQRCVALTFDDGMRSLATTAAPALSALGAPATLFLTTDYVGKDNHWPSQPPLAPRKAAGWSIQAHTRTHPDLRTLGDDALEAELCEPLDVIERRLGHRPSSFAYPYGYFNERVRAPRATIASRSARAWRRWARLRPIHTASLGSTRSTFARPRCMRGSGPCAFARTCKRAPSCDASESTPASASSRPN